MSGCRQARREIRVNYELAPAVIAPRTVFSPPPSTNTMQRLKCFASCHCRDACSARVCPMRRRGSCSPSTLGAGYHHNSQATPNQATSTACQTSTQSPRRFLPCTVAHRRLPLSAPEGARTLTPTARPSNLPGLTLGEHLPVANPYFNRLESMSLCLIQSQFPTNASHAPCTLHHGRRSRSPCPYARAYGGKT
jgi:hypothetical protein